ncbi:hypothetical protein ACN47E_001573 [Coniothyrium glycines]
MLGQAPATQASSAITIEEALAKQTGVAEDLACKVQITSETLKSTEEALVKQAKTSTDLKAELDIVKEALAIEREIVRDLDTKLCTAEATSASLNKALNGQLQASNHLTARLKLTEEYLDDLYEELKTVNRVLEASHETLTQETQDSKDPVMRLDATSKDLTVVKKALARGFQTQDKMAVELNTTKSTFSSQQEILTMRVQHEISTRARAQATARSTVKRLNSTIVSLQAGFRQVERSQEVKSTSMSKLVNDTRLTREAAHTAATRTDSERAKEQQDHQEQLAHIQSQSDDYQARLVATAENVDQLERRLAKEKSDHAKTISDLNVSVKHHEDLAVVTQAFSQCYYEMVAKTWLHLTSSEYKGKILPIDIAADTLTEIHRRELGDIVGRFATLGTTFGDLKKAYNETADLFIGTVAKYRIGANALKEQRGLVRQLSHEKAALKSLTERQNDDLKRLMAAHEKHTTTYKDCITADLALIKRCGEKLGE